MFIQQDLYDALRHDTCPICHLLANDVSKYVDSIFYEFVNTPETHFAMRASRGLCATHGARALEGMGNALGIAVLYKGILNEMIAVSERPDSAAARLFTRKDAESALAPSANCPVCTFQERAEQHYLKTFATACEDGEFLNAYQHSSGICLPHLRAVLKLTHLSATTKLLSAHRIIWIRLRDQLDEFARKYLAEHKDEQVGIEGDSWQRAVRALSGDEALFGREA